MYPRISDLFADLFGINLPITLYSFGLMVATAIVTATWLTRLELDRMYAAGLVGPVRITERDKKGRVRQVQASPSALVWTMMALAAIFGVIGSKLFHVIDYWERFLQDPAGLLFSGAGLTFYGGLITAALVIAYYAHRKGIHVPRLADATAPGLILAYGIGRIGCYLAGDGDWGICSRLADKPAWIPAWLWSETFPRNVIGPGMTPVDVIQDAQAKAVALGFSPDVCAGADGVYPTMLYEFAVCAVLAGVLWALRKHPFRAGWLFSLYLVFTGVQRFTIEMIRLNPDLVFGLSQAQVISVVLVVLGVAGLAYTSRRAAAPPQAPAAPAPASAA